MSRGATIDIKATGGGLVDEPLVGILTAIAIDDPGAGYTSAPTVTITGGGATSDATATATIDAGTGLLTGITIDDPGAGYTSAPTVTINPDGGATLDATATASVSPLITVDQNGSWLVTSGRTFTDEEIIRLQQHKQMQLVMKVTFRQRLLLLTRVLGQQPLPLTRFQ